MHFVNGVLHIGDQSALELTERYGSPLYVYDAAVIRRQIARVRTAFASLPLTPCYAVKANGNVSILRMMVEAGFGCDVVSPGEVFLARHAGFAPDRIWFTCSNVSDDDLLAIAERRIIINVNSMSELDRIVRLQLLNPVALRINPDVGAGHHRDVVTGGYGVKFGIELAEVDGARGLAESAGLRVVGLHAHIGSGIGEIDPLIESARTILGLVDEGWSDLRWLNFGGGMAVPYKPRERDFPVDEYGSRLHALASRTLQERGLSAIVEPGRYLLAQSGVLLTQVTARRISAGNEWIGVDTGFNHLARPSKYGAYHHILNASRGRDGDLRENFQPEGRPEVIVAGNICESGDVFTRDQEGPIPRRLPPFLQGDVLAFCDAGAYGYSMASHYNARLFPAEVMVDGTTVTVIRERQTYEDLLRGQPALEARTA